MGGSVPFDASATLLNGDGERREGRGDSNQQNNSNPSRMSTVGDRRRSHTVDNPLNSADQVL